MTPQIRFGEAVPPFFARSATNPRFAWDTLAGRYVMVLIPGSLGQPGLAERLAAAVAPQVSRLYTGFAVLIVIGTDPEDEAARRLTDGPGRRVLWDDSGEALRAFRAAGPEGAPRPGWVLLDPQLRVLGVWPLEEGEQAMEILSRLPPVSLHAGVEVTAPVLVLPRVFEPGFCRRLIEFYESVGGAESGFMRDEGGQTVGVRDTSHKRRRDAHVADAGLQAEIRARLIRRLVPEIARAFQFRATRLERYVVACYDSEERGFFRAHRDNTTLATAHRRFACTINLNTGEYEGGDLVFPEFGPRPYRAPLGGAVVFSCSLLHEARPVTRGRRYAFLPFLYDNEAAALRAQGARHLGRNDALGARPGGAEAAG